MQGQRPGWSLPFFLLMHPTSTPIPPNPPIFKKKLENPTNLCYDIC